jgi:GNAT superfamily N-acetyltransferase
MALIDRLTIGELEAGAVAEAFALTVEAGWNQTAEDLAFFLSHGTVYAARDVAGRLIATAAVLPYSGNSPDELGFAWVSLVVVTASQRGRGLGTRMLLQCIDELRRRSLPGLLDATPAGEKVYTPLGFKPVLGLQRWQGEGGGACGLHERVRPLVAAGIARIADFDASVFGAQRQALLAHFCARAGTRGFELADGIGYALVRSGRVASQLGPVVATSAGDAIALIDAATSSTRGRLFVDVPDAQTKIAAWLGAHGFTLQRPLLRMALGRASPLGDPARMFAIAGPEYG